MNEYQKATEYDEEVRASLAPSGILPMGWFLTEEERPALLLGNIGSSLWPAFSSSDIYQDGHPNGLDRWTVAKITPVANALECEARFPFGEQLWPFQKWAKAATGMEQSMIGLLIHPKFGLWNAFRAALVFEENFSIPPVNDLERPCENCSLKPCLNTCPIGAFTSAGYDFQSCRGFLRTAQGSTCMSMGCQARHACPIGQEHRYEVPHSAFHMKAYA